MRLQAQKSSHIQRSHPNQSPIWISRGDMKLGYVSTYWHACKHLIPPSPPSPPSHTYRALTPSKAPSRIQQLAHLEWTSCSAVWTTTRHASPSTRLVVVQPRLTCVSFKMIMGSFINNYEARTATSQASLRTPFLLRSCHLWTGLSDPCQAKSSSILDGEWCERGCCVRQN